MGLDVYRRKRNFRRTPEPRGERIPRKDSYRYVIQKHAARRLHYDLRLELNGTFKSWAVPKGPSLDPKNKRLAVQVEDHPLEYGKFEGNIPKPEYGAGAVIVWDHGVWHPDDDPVAGYRKGHLRFHLEGEKLRGGFNLIRTRPSASDKEQWLLIKSKDEYATGMDVVAAMPRSVQTGRTIEDLTAERPVRTSPLPRLLRPQLATLVDKAPEGPQWLHEIKYDGYRVLCRADRRRAKLYSRNGNDLTPRMAAVARAVESIPGLGDAWIDGEVVGLDADGRTSFSALQAALSDGRDEDLVYYLFDLPYVAGQNLTTEPLIARKQRLAALLHSVTPTDKHLRYSDHVQGEGARFYQEACRFGLEGIVSKRLDAPYGSGRGQNWVKTKCRLRQEFLVCGYTAPRGSRQDIGALALGVYDATGRLTYSGRTGTGFNTQTLAALRQRLEPLKISAPPFPDPLPSEARKGVTWVRPETVIEVEFAGWTRDNLARQASYQGVREDKNPREVVREVAQSLPPPDTAPSKYVKAERAAARLLTNPDKVLYPEQGLTKADLASYYASVADWILPHIKKRPLTLVRCPDGRHKQCFFQKHAVDAGPQFTRVTIKENNGAREYLALDSVEGLFALVQMGALEIHVWGSRIDKLEYPDYFVMDLDPDPALPWAEVLDAAALTRARLADLGLTGFLRTTGGKGLHVVVPIVRRQTWDEVKAFTKALAEDLVRQNPERYTARMALAEDLVRQNPERYTARMALAGRKGKIYIDYLRNGRGATAIASYSTRARAGAPVAVPLYWEELTPKLQPEQFNVLTVPSRLQSLKRDPWDDFDDARRAITVSMKRALGLKN